MFPLGYPQSSPLAQWKLFLILHFVLVNIKYFISFRFYPFWLEEKSNYFAKEITISSKNYNFYTILGKVCINRSSVNSRKRLQEIILVKLFVNQAWIVEEKSLSACLSPLDYYHPHLELFFILLVLVTLIIPSVHFDLEVSSFIRYIWIFSFVKLEDAIFKPWSSSSEETSANRTWCWWYRATGAKNPGSRRRK